ncbi:MAG: pyrophosphate--fructose-6-phosphate 1-phosphotransferase, partial [Dermabacter sp.]|nr:pyrophosphate--fructose-6-phosphate 1-phosphotransferase [Dermabacter sp.]
MSVKRVALLTAGGYAPCLSSAVGGLIERYNELNPEIEIIAYKHGYWGLLSGEKIVIDDEARKNAHLLHNYGGSPIGNSRVKLTNTKNLVERGLIKEGENALEVAANKLKADGVDVLHTIGGDDTNTTAADLAKYLADNNYPLQVVGLPKTIDNDIVPIRQSLGARTAAEQTSLFAQNIIAENGSNPRMLIIHEIMGRACGYLTAEAARYYQDWHSKQQWLPSIGHDERRWDVHAVFLPELALDIEGEAERLKKVMDEVGCVNIFLSEGAGIPEIIAELEAKGEEV